MDRLFPASLLMRLRGPRWGWVVLCLLMPSYLSQTAYTWQECLHAISPVAQQHHVVHHTAEPYEISYDQAPSDDTEHHQNHHAENCDHSYQALLNSLKCRLAPVQSIELPVLAAVPVQGLLPSPPRAIIPSGRAGPDDELPPPQHLSLPLAGRSPPVA